MSMTTTSSAAAGVAPPLKAYQKLAYGSADFGFNLFYTYLNFFLLFYYTNILGIDPAIAGLIFALAVIWDAVTDPLMGGIASRTRTKMGRYRPYILFGTPLLALSFISMFAAPLLFPTAIVTVSAICHLLFRTCYTIVSIPYTALSAAMTTDGQERSTLAGLRMFFAATSGLFTVLITMGLAQRLGGGDMVMGFFYVSLLYATAASAFFIATFFLTTESATAATIKTLTLADTWRMLSRNRPLAILMSAIVIGSIGSSIFNKALIYYVTDVAQLEMGIAEALTFLLAAVSLSVPIWTLVIKRLSKRATWMVGASITLMMYSILYFFPPVTVPAFLAVMVGLGIGAGSFAVTFWSMLPDTVEVGEWRSGIRDEGIVFGLNQLALKAANGIGVGLLGFALGAVGYVANQPQTEATMAGMHAIAILSPLVCSALAVAIISLYPVDQSLHARLVRALAWRRARTATS